MKDIYFVDQTLRDAHQSLWATRMSTAMIAPIASVIDEVGYRHAQVMASVQVDACVRWLRDNPWERLRILKKAMPKTPLWGGSRNNSPTTFNVAPYSVLGLFCKVLAENGVTRFALFDALCDYEGESTRTMVPILRTLGLELEVSLVYVISPVHTDEYYAQKAAQAVALLKPYSIMVKDSMGILTPERVRTLVPAVQRVIGDTQLEMHCHCNTALAQLCYIEGMKLGVDTFHTATSPMANGNSLPSVENTARNARLLGYSPHINDEAAEVVAKHFAYVAKREGKPLGVPVEYSVFNHLNGMAGGTISNLRFMLDQRGMGNRWEEVVEEISRLGEEWGYPPNVTPYSQVMNTQAVLNVVSGERYSVVVEETVNYLLGHFGKPPGPVDQNVVDKVTSLPEAKHLLNWKPPQPSLEEIRREHGGPGMPDEELLLRYMFPPEHVEAMYAAPPRPYHVRGDKPNMALVEELLRKDVSYLSVRKDGFALTLRRDESKMTGRLN